MPVEPNLVKSVFLAAVNKAVPAERAAYLDEACAGNAPLRQRVEALLKAHDESEGLLEPPAVPPASEPPPTRITVVATPDRIGPYKLLQKIGEGGMGEVWMAEQEQPIKRRVALKIIKPGMDSRQIIARFEAERQALALMDHPNIAKVLDAGECGAGFQPALPALPSSGRLETGPTGGRPYFVMELVKGVPLTQFCDGRQLSVGDRLTIFQQICHAVQHAHQKGIIHRDLKPTNILVESHDGRPVPKIIDFGLAKAMHGMPLTDRSLFTQFGAAMGTWQYMSPEQAEVSAIDVDTRSDIYSLGVILYELLTGTTPLERERLKKAALNEIQRIIKEEEPPKPSTRLSNLGNVGRFSKPSGNAGRFGKPSHSATPTSSLASIAAQRHTEPSNLSKFVRGDLDWIVMKALAKERDRRYDTANAFAADVERFLHHEPVSAGPPTVRYKLRKFVRRNRGPVIAAAGFAALVLLGIVGLIVAIVAVNAERQRTADALARVTEEEQKTQAALKDAKEELATREAVQVFFLNKVFAAARPKDQEGGLGKDVTLRQAIDAAEPSIAGAFKDRPLVEAAIRSVLGETYRYLGEPTLGVAQLEQACRLLVAKLGTTHPQTQIELHNLALAYLTLGRHSEALSILEKALRSLRDRLGPAHKETLTVATSVAQAYHDVGREADALALYEETLKLLESSVGPEGPHTLRTKSKLANAYLDAGRFNEALPLLEHVLRVQQAKFGRHHLDTLGSMNVLGKANANAGKLDRAIPLLEEVLSQFRVVLGPDHSNTHVAMANLGTALAQTGRLPEAVKLLTEAYDCQKATLGVGHPRTLTIANDLAAAYLRSQQLHEAIRLFEETLRVQKTKLPHSHPDTLVTMNNLAKTYLDAGRIGDGLTLLRETSELMEAAHGRDHPATLTAMGNLALAQWKNGQVSEARTLLEEVLMHRKRRLGNAHPDTLESKHNLGKLLLKSRLDFQRAAALLREAADCARSELGLLHPHTPIIIGSLIDCYETVGEPVKAEPLIRELADFWKQQAGANSPQYAGQLAALGNNLLQQKKPSAAEPILRECLAIRAKQEPDAWTTFNTQSMLGGALLEQARSASKGNDAATLARAAGWYRDAEPLLLAGYEGMKQRQDMIPANGKVRLPEAIERLVQLYEALDKKDEAAKWRKELETMKAADKKP